MRFCDVATEKARLPAPVKNDGLGAALGHRSIDVTADGNAIIRSQRVDFLLTRNGDPTGAVGVFYGNVR